MGCSTVFMLLAAIVSCEAKPKVDVRAIEEQIQKEAYEFEKVIGEIGTATDTIKCLADFSLSSLLPQDWLCDVNPPSGEKLSVAFGIPIPKDAVRELVSTKTDQGWVYLTRGGRLDPDTDKYIVSAYSGTTKYTLLEGARVPKDWREYPKLLQLNCFPDKKIVQSPYYIPNEATHGLYLLSWDEFRESRNNYNIAQPLNDLSAANPYVEKRGTAQYEAPKLADVVKRFKGQLAAINKDMNTANSLIIESEKKFGKNLSAWNMQGAIDNFKKMLSDNKAKLSQIDASLDKIDKWDFSKLEQYRSLKAN